MTDLGLSGFGNAVSFSEVSGLGFTDDLPRLFLGTDPGPGGSAEAVKLLDIYSLADPRPSPSFSFAVFEPNDEPLTDPDATVKLVLANGTSELALATLSAAQAGAEDLTFHFLDTMNAEIGSLAVGSLLMLPADGSAVLYDPAYSEDTGSSGCELNIIDDVGDSCAETIAAELTCLPSSGNLPFTTTMTVQLTNLDPLRPATRIAARINISLANGSNVSSWRRGFTNVAPGANLIRQWNQNLPALAFLLGDNIFRLAAEDVTPAPYNQPPYTPAGDTETDNCTVTGVAP